jgi:hypothetical protein
MAQQQGEYPSPATEPFIGLIGNFTTGRPNFSNDGPDSGVTVHFPHAK